MLPPEKHRRVEAFVVSTEECIVLFQNAVVGGAILRQRSIARLKNLKYGLYTRAWQLLLKAILREQTEARGRL